MCNSCVCAASGDQSANMKSLIKFTLALPKGELVGPFICRCIEKGLTLLKGFREKRGPRSSSGCAIELGGSEELSCAV